MDVVKIVNAISGNPQKRGSKLCDGIINEINGINNTYLAGMESILKVKPSREELLAENLRLRKALKQANAQLFKFGQVFDRFAANKKLSKEVNDEIDAERGQEVERTPKDFGIDYHEEELIEKNK